MMKPILLALLCALTLSATDAYADTPDPAAVQTLREQVRADKKKLISDNLELSASEAQRFWPVYEQYQRDRDTIRQRLNLALIDFMAVDGKLSDANAKRLVGDINTAERDLIALRDRYFGKFSKAATAAKAARYLQIETKLDALQRYDQALAVPLAR